MGISVAIIGYARVSSLGQKLEIQVDKLENQGCERIYQEKGSGLTTKRPQLKACLAYVREGDTLIVTKLDRLARSTFDLCSLSQRLHEKNVVLKVLDQDIDTSNPTGRLLFHTLSAIAQFETEIRLERQREGIQKAKERGVSFGRTKALTETQALELRVKRKEGVLIKDLMKEYKLSKKSIYNYIEVR